MALYSGVPKPYSSLMNTTTKASGLTYTATSGTTYSYDVVRQTRTDYTRFMDPTSKYERVYFQVNVYDANGKRVNFGFVDDETDTAAISGVIEAVDEWVRTPAHVLESMHSRFD